MRLLGWLFSIITPLVLLAPTGVGQHSSFIDITKLETEVGSFEELKNVKKLFVHTKLNEIQNSEMIEELKRSRLPFELVDSPEDAEIILSFGITATQSTSKLPDIDGNISRRQLGYSFTRYRGRGIVFKRLSLEKIRILVDFDQRKADRFFSSPWRMFVADFVKKFRSANRNR